MSLGFLVNVGTALLSCNWALSEKTGALHVTNRVGRSGSVSSITSGGHVI